LLYALKSANLYLLCLYFKNDQGDGVMGIPVMAGHSRQMSFWTKLLLYFLTNYKIMVGGEGLWNDVYPGVRWPNPGIIKLIFVFIALKKSKGNVE